MYRNSSGVQTAILFLALTPVLSVGVLVHAQSSVSAGQPRPAVSVLDSTKEQDGLVGSVRRVKIESAKIEVKEGRQVEGPRQLLELTTYGINGNRIENISYPIGDSLIGKEEYKYDKRGNIIEMTLRDEQGAIVSREAYTYEFDPFGNWTKMVTSLVVFENGELKREPVEITYRTLTYYFDDSIAKIVDEPPSRTVSEVPEPSALRPARLEPIQIESEAFSYGEVTASSLAPAGDPPALSARHLDVEKPLATFIAANARSNAPIQPKSSMDPGPRPAVGAGDTAAPQPNDVSGATGVDVRKKVRMSSADRDNASMTETATPDPVNTSDVFAQKKAFDYYQAGLARFESGDWKAAAAAYVESLKLEPKSAEVHLNLGHAYLRLEKDNDAAKAFKESIKLNPQVAEAHYGLGFVEYRMHRYREAADAFKRATVVDPKMAKAHYGLSLAYEQLKDQNGLLREFRILETLDRDLAKKLTLAFPEVPFNCRLTPICR